MARVVVTGSNRGIGLGFVTALLARGDTVFATCRDPDRAHALRALDPGDGRLVVLPLDVGDERAIATAAAEIAARTAVVDLLVHNAGIYSDTETFGSVGFAPMLDALRINAVAPLVLTEALWPLLARSSAPRIVAITSGYGSIGANTGGFPYTYATSKAALNQIMRSVAADLGPRGAIVLLLNPGWVQTDMGGEGALLSVEESVAGMLRLVDHAKPADNGRFYSHLGEREPW
jgi:NAD(P)-dependent dehydrogenase (short-subunit alcohol dehydrogenase family)